MRFYDSNIRFRYFMDPRQLIKGKLTNTSKEWTIDEIDIETITLRRTSGYQNEFKFEYKNEKLLDGIETFQVLLHTNETYDLDLYEGWNFTDKELWDEFWFEPETNKLFQTNVYNLTIKSVSQITIRTQPSLYRLKN